MKTNYREFTIASSGVSGFVETEDWDTFGLVIPTLDSTTVKVMGSHDGVSYYDIYDGNGVQVLNWATATTGARLVSSLEMAHAAAYKYLCVLCGSAQSGGARTLALVFKAPMRQ